MKPIHAFVFLLLASGFAYPLLAQAPEKLGYNAVIRNSSGALIRNTQVGMRVTILQGGAEGSAVYTETHAPTSNDNGLINILVGGGTPVSGNYADIDWSVGNYYLKTEVDPAGGSSYSISSTSNFTSVPYALYAKSSGGSSSGGSGQHFVGEVFGGGIVGYVTPDGQHGLIISKENVGIGESWGIQWNADAATDFSEDFTTHNGKYNTEKILATTIGAAIMNYRTLHGNDWYIPSIGELNLIFSNLNTLDFILENNNDDTTEPVYSDGTDYWSSTFYYTGKVLTIKHSFGTGYLSSEDNRYYSSNGVYNDVEDVDSQALLRPVKSF